MSNGKKAGLSKETIQKNLREIENINLSDEQAEQYFKSQARIKDGDILDEMEIWIRQKYQLKRNEITRYIENRGVTMKQKIN